MMQIRDIIRENRGYPVFSLLASIIALIAAIDYVANDNTDQTGGNVSLFGSIALLFLIIVYFWQGKGTGRSDRPKTQAVLAFLLFVGWGAYTGYTTFVSPFRVPANGYFSSWFGFLTAVGLFVLRLRWLEGKASQKIHSVPNPFLIILIGSAVVAIEGGIVCCGTSLSVYAVVMGTSTFVVTTVYLLLFANPRIHQFWYAAFFSIYWLIAAFVLSFDFFVQAGNGYFGAWGCAIASLVMLRRRYRL